MSQYNGEYGGRVLRAFKGDGVAFVKGAILTPKMVMDWPLSNRMALHKIDKVEWYGPLDKEETEARAEEVSETSQPTVEVKQDSKLLSIAEALNSVLNLSPAININLPEEELTGAVKVSAALIGLDENDAVSQEIVESDKSLFETSFKGVWESMRERGLLFHLTQ